MTPTIEQMAFFAEVERGRGNILLESVAGSGKTTSIVESLNYIDDTWPVLACSFTKLAADQLGERIRKQNFTNVTSSTLNSVGWGVCRNNIRGVQLDANKTLNILQAQLNRNCPTHLDKKKLYSALKGPVKRLVGLLKAYAEDPEQPELYSRIAEIAAYHSVDLAEGESSEAKYAREVTFNRVMAVYQQSVQTTAFMDFDDQKFMPVYYRWEMPSYRVIYVDECQDMSVCDIAMIERFKGARIVFVGDRKQAIYFFRGSQLNAMDTLLDKFRCNYKTLSVCFRCADDILIEAKEISPLIRSPEPNPKGKGVVEDVSTKEFLEKVAVGDYVICRTTAPLIKRCLELVRKGKPAKVKGREVGRSLLDLIDKVAERISGFDPASNETLLEFLGALSCHTTETVARLEAAKLEDAAIRVLDESEALNYFCLDCNCINEVADKIYDLFTDDGDDTKLILLLTAHKSKGLERDTVWFLRPDLVPFPRAKSEHEIQTEMNLKYVILTRAALNRFHVQKETGEK